MNTKPIFVHFANSPDHCFSLLHHLAEKFPPVAALNGNEATVNEATVWFDNVALDDLNSLRGLSYGTQPPFEANPCGTIGDAIAHLDRLIVETCKKKLPKSVVATLTNWLRQESKPYSPEDLPEDKAAAYWENFFWNYIRLLWPNPTANGENAFVPPSLVAVMKIYPAALSYDEDGSPEIAYRFERDSCCPPASLCDPIGADFSYHVQDGGTWERIDEVTRHHCYLVIKYERESAISTVLRQNDVLSAQSLGVRPRDHWAIRESELFIYSADAVLTNLLPTSVRESLREYSPQIYWLLKSAAAAIGNYREPLAEPFWLNPVVQHVSMQHAIQRINSNSARPSVLSFISENAGFFSKFSPFIAPEEVEAWNALKQECKQSSNTIEAEDPSTTVVACITLRELLSRKKHAKLRSLVAQHQSLLATLEEFLRNPFLHKKLKATSHERMIQKFFCSLYESSKGDSDIAYYTIIEPGLCSSESFIVEKPKPKKEREYDYPEFDVCLDKRIRELLDKHEKEAKKCITPLLAEARGWSVKALFDFADNDRSLLFVGKLLLGIRNKVCHGMVGPKQDCGESIALCNYEDWIEFRLTPASLTTIFRLMVAAIAAVAIREKLVDETEVEILKHYATAPRADNAN